MAAEIIITEAKIVETFKKMCLESLPPEQYEHLTQEILPRLKLARKKLQPDYCPNKGYYACLDLIVEMFKAMPMGDEFNRLKKEFDKITII